MTFSNLLRIVGLTALTMMLFCTNADAQDDMRLLYNKNTGNVQIEIINPLIQLFSIETLGPTGNSGSGFLLFNNVDNSSAVGAPITTPPANQDTIAFLSPSNPAPLGIVDLGNILPTGITFVSTDATDTLSSGTDESGNLVGFGAVAYTVSGIAGDPGFSDQTAFTTVTGGVCGDVDLNGAVNFLDIQPFILVLSSDGFQAEADCDENGVVNFLDIQPFIVALTGN